MSAPRQRKWVALCHWGRDFGAGCSGSIPQRDGLGGGWEFQGERSFQSCWDWSRDSGALVSWTPDLQKGPGVRAGAGVEWGLENEGSKDSLRGEEGPPSPGAPSQSTRGVVRSSASPSGARLCGERGKMGGID